MSPKAQKVVGFLVAGAALVALGEVAPQAAIGLTAVIGLGVLLAHANEVQQLSNAFMTATGHPVAQATPQQAGAIAGQSIATQMFG